VHGNLTTPSLEIERGSVFEGNCQMSEAQPARAVAAVPDEPAVEA
jgi:cytoskeletal protein CcmA (bactofilin family)